MSWLFSRALVEAYSADTCLDGAPCALLSGTPTLQASWLPVKTTKHCRLSQSGMTFKPLTAAHGEAVLTSFLEAFPARTSALPERVQELTESALQCGHTWHELSARYDLVTRSWRTHRCLWDEALPESSVTLPRWGMMRDGVLFQQKTPELLTRENESGLLLPTPVKTQTNQPLELLAARAKRHGGHVQMRLESLAMHFDRRPNIKDESNKDLIQKWEAQYGPMFEKKCLWPTPTAHNAKEGNYQSEKERNTPTLAAQAGGMLNPTWVEWLMGWPLGYTDLQPLATDKYQQWQQLHGGF